jgi:UDP-N-acetylmuramoyl-tripeptide--D-alanyl-D-alanine ligase
VRSGLEAFRPVAMRSELKDVQGRTVLADYYNANPGSMNAALETLASLKTGTRTIAVLGDMLELGDTAAEAHRTIGAVAMKLGIDLMITVGPLAKHIAEGALAAGMSRERVFETDTTSRGAELLRGHSRPGDTVLIKGSRGMKMEKILEEF